MIVTDVTRGGLASLAGLRSGDLLLRILGEEVPDIKAFDVLVKKVKETKPEVVSVFVRRGYRTAFVFISTDVRK